MLDLRIQQARSHCAALLRRIRTAVDEGKVERARRLTRKYLHSFDARLVAVEKANRKQPIARRLTAAQLFDFADQLDVYSVNAERVRVKSLPKGRGDFRPIMIFGIESYARQLLVKSVLAVQAKISERQYAQRGGREAALRTAEQAIKKDYKWVLMGDIRNCFGSLNGPLHILLPLPHAVTNNNVRAINLNLEADNSLTRNVTNHGVLIRGRQGIPQG